MDVSRSAGIRAASSLPARPEGDPAPTTRPQRLGLLADVRAKGEGPAQIPGAHHFRGQSELLHMGISPDNRFQALDLQRGRICDLRLLHTRLYLIHNGPRRFGPLNPA